MRDPAIAREKLQVPSLDQLAAGLEDLHSGVLQAVANVFLYIDKLCYPPVGAIIAWHKNFSNGVPPLPENWRECNGQMLNDPTSPLHGVTLPDLNGENRFLRGSNTSGNLYGDPTHAHTYAGTIDATVDTVEVQGGSGQFVAATTHVHTYGGQTDAADTIPPSMEIVWIIRIK
jgi:hypothetical protein